MRLDHSYYLHEIFNPMNLGKLVDKVHKDLINIDCKHHFDIIAFSGNSGAGVCYPLSAIYSWDILCVRKEHESSHGCILEGPNKETKSYIIVDDLIASGETVKRIRDTIDTYRLSEDRITYIGVYTYSNGCFTVNHEL